MFVRGGELTTGGRIDEQGEKSGKEYKDKTNGPQPCLYDCYRVECLSFGVLAYL